MRLFDVLDDPRVEWELVETNGTWHYRWTVSVGDQKRTDVALFEDSAYADMRRFARIALGQARIDGRTRPCVICDKPSRVGEPIDSDECQRLLDKARAELVPSVL